MATLAAIEVVRALDAELSELAQVMALLRVAGHEPEQLPVAAGDRALMLLAAEVTGAPIEFTADCPNCGERNEVRIEAADLGPHEPRSAWLGPSEGVRQPAYGDLVDLPSEPTTAAAELARRCTHGSVRLERALAALDDIDDSLAGPIEMACVECAEPMSVDVDVELLAIEAMSALAARTEREVHLLATHYGWDLSTIEALPDARRSRLARMMEQPS